MRTGDKRTGDDVPAEGEESNGIDYFGKGSRLLRFKTGQSLKARRAMFDVFMRESRVTARSTVIDIGVTPDRSLADSNAFERFYPWTNRVTATSFEDASSLEVEFPGLAFVKTEGERLPFPDNHFDAAYSSAVLEHVGTATQQRLFLAEVARVSKFFFIAVPNRWFPLELHTFIPIIHWLPKPIHRKILHAAGMPFWAEEKNLNLVGEGELRSLFPSELTVTIHKHRLLGLPSNLVAYGRS